MTNFAQILQSSVITLCTVVLLSMTSHLSGHVIRQRSVSSAGGGVSSSYECPAPTASPTNGNREISQSKSNSSSIFYKNSSAHLILYKAIIFVRFIRRIWKWFWSCTVTVKILWQDHNIHTIYKRLYLKYILHAHFCLLEDICGKDVCRGRIIKDAVFAMY